jgi:hypothetical protein
VYHFSKLSETKNQILSSLSSQTISNTGEILYKSQENYSFRHSVPVLPPDKNEPRYSINVAKHEDGNSVAFFFKSIS